VDGVADDHLRLPLAPVRHRRRELRRHRGRHERDVHAHERGRRHDHARDRHATNSAGSASATSAQTATTTAVAPVNTTAPSISGTARDGEVLTLDRGSWTGTPTITYAVQWRRCDTAGANCADIANATGQTYTLTAADTGRTIRAVVTATNAAGSTPASTTATATVGVAPPVNTTAPTISGTARDGETLTGTRGTWTGTEPLTYAYKWRRCDASGANCTDIPGAASLTYALTAADVGHVLVLQVTATNAAGSATARDVPTDKVVAAPPVNRTLPTVSGTARDGSTLTAATNGTWSGTAPLRFGYAWLRCDTNGANCAAIAGATSSTYELTPDDVGRVVKVRVTATNDAGSASADSAGTSAVAPVAPANVAPPTISGIAREGATLTAADGTWTGTPQIAFTYAWQRCDANGANCTNIAGATNRTYTTVAADTGSRIRVVVTATNAAGNASAASSPGVGEPVRTGPDDRAVDLGHAAGRRDAHGRPRHVERHAADLRLPVGPLRQPPARAAPTSPARRAAPTSPGRTTSAGGWSCASPRRTPPAPRPACRPRRGPWRPSPGEHDRALDHRAPPATGRR
jgi:hypothetical protein